MNKENIKTILISDDEDTEKIIHVVALYKDGSFWSIARHIPKDLLNETEMFAKAVAKKLNAEFRLEFGFLAQKYDEYAKEHERYVRRNKK